MRETIRDHQRPSAAIRGESRPNSILIRKIIRGHQRPSKVMGVSKMAEAIRGHQKSIRASKLTEDGKVIRLPFETVHRMAGGPEEGRATREGEGFDGVGARCIPN